MIEVICFIRFEILWQKNKSKSKKVKVKVKFGILFEKLTKNYFLVGIFPN